MSKNPIEANYLRYGRLIIAFAKSPYDCWIYKNNNGKFIFTDRSIFFQSELADKNFERFPFFENHYFHFKKPFMDYAIVGLDECIFILCLYDNDVIKPLYINGCTCGDIFIDEQTTLKTFYYTCGQALITNKLVRVVKPFKTEVETFKFQRFKGDSHLGGLY